MVDSSSTTTPNLSGGSFQSFLSSLSGKEQEAKSNVDQAVKTFEVKSGEIDKERKAAGELKPPTLTEQPYTPPAKTDPMQAFGSPAMWLAVFGGMLTKRHLETSLNAAAGVLNAYRQHDEQAANQHFEQWKVANENALKMHQFQNETYKTALENVSKDQNSAIAELKAKASAFDDKTMLLALTHSIGEAMRLQEAREKQFDSFEKSIPAMELGKLKLSATTGLLKARQTGDQAGVAKYTQQLRDIDTGQHTAAEEGLSDRETGNTPKSQQRQTDLQGLVSQIDSVQQLLSAHSGVAGATGVAEKLWNSTAGQIPALTIEEKAQFDARIKALQTTMQNQYLNSRYFGRSGLERMEELIPGLDIATGPEETRIALDKIREVIQTELKPSASGGGSTAGEDYSHLWTK